MVTASADELADMLGVHPRTLRDLTARGIVVRAGRNQYDVAGSVRAYCGSLREAASGRGSGSTVNALAAERSRLAKEQADAAALKNAALRGELLPAADVEREWSAILLGLRATFLAMPARIRQRLGHLTAHDVSTIEDMVREVLTEAST